MQIFYFAYVKTLKLWLRLGLDTDNSC